MSCIDLFDFVGVQVFRIEVIIALLILIEIFFHLLDKSQTWQHFTWEAFFHSIFG
jgi:hypothetical protein